MDGDRDDHNEIEQYKVETGGKGGIGTHGESFGMLKKLLCAVVDEKNRKISHFLASLLGKAPAIGQTDHQYRLVQDRRR